MTENGGKTAGVPLLSQGSDGSKTGGSAAETLGSNGATSLSTCTFNLVLSTVGVGGLTLPYAMARIGWEMSFAYMAIFLLLSVYGLVLLDVACRDAPLPPEALSSYGSVVSVYLGRPGAYMLEVFMLLYCFGLCVSYLGQVGTEVLALAAELQLAPSWFLDQQYMTSFVVLAFALPTSLLPQSVLLQAGAVGTCCMVFITLAVILQVPWSALPPFVDLCAGPMGVSSGPNGKFGHPVAVTWSLPSMIDTAPLYTFSFNAAFAFVVIRSQLQPGSQPPQKKVSSLIWVGQLIALLDYVGLSMAGYATFCEWAPDNVLNGYPTAEPLALTARAALALQLTVAVAGVYTPLARASSWHLLRGLAASPPGRLVRAALTTTILLVTGFVAVKLGGALALPLGLTSAVCTTALMFIFPGLCVAKARLGSRACLGPLAVVMFGFLMGTVSTLSLLRGL